MFGWVALALAVLIVAHSSGLLGGIWSRIKGAAIPVGVRSDHASLDAMPTAELVDYLASRLEREKAAAAAAQRSQAILDAFSAAHAQVTTPVPKS